VGAVLALQQQQQSEGQRLSGVVYELANLFTKNRLCISAAFKDLSLE